MTSKNNEAKACNAVAVGFYFPTGEEGQTYYLSVYTGTRESYSPLGRTIGGSIWGIPLHQSFSICSLVRIMSQSTLCLPNKSYCLPFKPCKNPPTQAVKKQRPSQRQKTH